jgi:hypothetical protein
MKKFIHISFIFFLFISALFIGYFYSQQAKNIKDLFNLTTPVKHVTSRITISPEEQEKRNMIRKKILQQELTMETQQLIETQQNIHKLESHYNDPSIVNHFKIEEKSHLSNIETLNKVLSKN